MPRITNELTKKVLRLASPVILSNMSLILLNIVDTIMVGRISPQALAATALGGFFYFTIAISIGSIGTGTLSIVARRYGEKKFNDCGKTIDNAIIIALVFGMLIVLFSPIIVNPIAPILSKDHAVVPLLAVYMRYRFYGIIFFLLNRVFNGFFSGIGRTDVRMKAAIILTVANIVFDYLLIFGKFGFPELGVKGAAIASIISVGFSTFYFAGVSLTSYKFHYSFFRFKNMDFQISKKILRFSFPLILQTLIGTGGYLVFFWIIGRIGTIELAAANVITSINSLAVMPSYGLGVAAATLVGQSLGAKNVKKARDSTFEAIKWTGISMTLFGIIFLLFPATLIGIYTPSNDVIEVGTTPLRISAVIFFIYATGIVFMKALEGAGDTKFIMITEFLITFIFYLPWVYIFGIVLNLGLVGAYMGEMFYVASHALFMVKRFRSSLWTQIEI